LKFVLLGAAVVVAAIVCVVAVAVVVGGHLPVAHVVSRSERFALPRERLWDLALAAYARTNDGTYAIVGQERPARLVTAIVDKKLPYGGNWTYEFAEAASGSVLTITERGEIYNPFFRFVARFLIGHTRTLDDYFANLRRAAVERG